MGNNTQFIFIIPTAGRNILDHKIIARVNNIYSVFESNMSIQQQESALIRLISLDWIWAILIVLGMLIGVFLVIFVYSKPEEDEKTKGKRQIRKKRWKKKTKK